MYYEFERKEKKRHDNTDTTTSNTNPNEKKDCSSMKTTNTCIASSDKEINHSAISQFELSKDVEKHEQKQRNQQRQGPVSVSKKRHGARNQHRHKILVRWLLKTFAKEFDLAKDSMFQKENTNNNNVKRPGLNDYHPTPPIEQKHILEIAGGGKGELSTRLVYCHNLHVTIIDPRPADIVNCLTKYVYRTLPNKWQTRITDRLDKEPGFLDIIQEKRFKQILDYFPMDGTTSHTRASSNSNATMSKFLLSPDVATTLPTKNEIMGLNEDMKRSVQQASLVIGMHADGATEAIVDICMHFRKPFIVCPCCVFPNFFRNRMVPLKEDFYDTLEETKVPSAADNHQLPPNLVNVNNPTMNISTHTNSLSPEGQNELDQLQSSSNVAFSNVKMIPVRTHEDFCRYLALKDSHFITEILPFEGRNVAIWWDGQYLDDAKE